ncbi:MAG: UDP-N-acetylmuramoyl-L-alanyl-D-glutamate--2,6-diaminopimelate ligase [Bacteroidota bacterium]
MESANLQELLYKVSIRAIHGGTDIVPTAIISDSRQAGPGTLFVAVSGTRNDGHQYITKVAEAGSSVIVCERMPEEVKAGVTYVEVADSAAALGQLASNFYGTPSEKMQVVGVTGTNGKTTVATLLYQLFRTLGYSTGLLSTIDNRIDEDIIPSTHTTPDPISLNALMRRMTDHGCTHCFMEVSSHALVQQRTAGIKFAGAVFTNISHDHLDYHLTFKAYIEAKKLLFDRLSSDAFALVNIDDKRGKIMLQNSRAVKRTYSLQAPADFKARVLSNSFRGLQMETDGMEAWFRLTGTFNAYNLLAIYGTAVLLGEERERCMTALTSLTPAPGRMDILQSRDNITVIIDYAHTPDALENVLATITDLRTRNEQLITVAGCGGNRDKAKRPLMAACAAKFSDVFVITSDNPRDEEPEEIIAEMQRGVSPANYRKTRVISDRREAIAFAVQQARPGDIVLIAGKGHENYQEIKGVKYPFDDKEVAAEYLEM